MKSKSLQKNLSMLMRNKIVLYVLLGLAIVNLFGYLMQNNLVAIGLFLVVGYGMTLATKNMAIVLLVTILVTNFVIRRGLLNNIGILEGMKPDKFDKRHAASHVTLARAKAIERANVAAASAKKSSAAKAKAEKAAKAAKAAKASAEAAAVTWSPPRPSATASAEKAIARAKAREKAPAQTTKQRLDAYLNNKNKKIPSQTDKQKEREESWESLFE